MEISVNTAILVLAAILIMLILNRIFLASITFSLTTSLSCGLDCIEKKTEMHKSSQSLIESKSNNVFQFETSFNRATFQLDNKRTFSIKNAWVETAWLYECVNNRAVIKKDSFSQFVIDGEYTASTDSLNYVLMERDGGHGCFLGGQLRFNYFGRDSIELVLKNDKTNTVIDTLIFIRTVGR